VSETLEYTMIDGIKCFSPDVAQAYTDYPDGGFDLTDRNAENSFWVSSRNRLFKDIVQRYRSPTGKTRFLEIGCGTGDFIQQIVDQNDLEITGSEVYLKGLLYAKKNLPGVEFVQFDVTQGKIGEQFDMITAFDVLEHIDDDRAAIANISAMLRPGGMLVVSVPQHMFMWGELDEIVKHKRRYSRGELLGKLAASGFETKRCSSFVFTLFPLMYLSRRLDKRRDPSHSDEAALARRVTFPPLLNWLLDRLMRVDEVLIKLGFSLPFGGTLLVVARKS